MNIKKKILDKSDMYNFYKEGYEYYKSNYENLLQNQKSQYMHENDNQILKQRLYYKINELINYQAKLENQINDLERILEKKNNEYSIIEKNLEIDNSLRAKNIEIDDLKNKLDSLNFELDNLNNVLNIKNNEIETLQNTLNLQNNEIKKINFPYHTLDEYLIESHISPLVFSPFSEESKRCFAFMEEIATFLSLKSNNIDKKPLISVIMPVYNRKDVVMKAINSVLEQTYENFELIVIDDASTDGTTELLKEIHHEKVRVIFHEQNKYASGARNTGLKASKGEYIAYLDSDNLLDKRYLAATVGAFLELPDAGGLYSAQYRYETYDSQPFAIQFGAFNKSLLHNHNYIDMNCFAHKREVYEKIGGFDETLKGADDWELILKISNHFKIYSAPFLLSKCYLGVVENRVSDLIPTDMGKIRSQNEMLPTTKGILDKNVNIIIPIYESTHNIEECIKHIKSLELNNLKIIISNNCSSIDIANQINDLKDENIKLIQNPTDYGFTNAINEGIKFADSDADIVFLSQNAILTEGSLESLQKHAYELSDCGLVVSTQILPNGSLIQKHVPYGHSDYWCDITPSKFYENIINVPLFHNGEILELNFAPFFCTYIKREVLDEYGELNSNLGKHYHSFRLLSDFIRHTLNLKIYHISEAIVINNLKEEDRNKNPSTEYDYNFNKNTWDSERYMDCGENYLWDF